ncbi:Paraspeckle component 1, partial [Biomphalaria glabrata]
RRSRFDQGQGGSDNYQSQRGVLGAPPGGLGGPVGFGGSQSALGGPQGTLGSTAAALARQMGGGPQGGMPGGGSPNMFQSAASLNERMMLERRREAAREELSDIKRMRRF